jgi:AcrR family transcriptional regulator
METDTPPALKARKKPRQARAQVTMEAIFEATIQVLLREGIHQLTTTRVAVRAGVSVGTMYQYFPNKQALIYALNERYLEMLAEKIEATCRAQNGAPLSDMVEALVQAYWQAKTERADVTRALYRSVVEMDNDALVHAFAARVNLATTAMLASTSDAAITDLEMTNLTLVTVIFGTIRNAFERDLDPVEGEDLCRQLVIMCQAYVRAIHT